MNGVVRVEDLRDEIFSLYRDGLPKTIKPKQERWKDVNKIFSVMMGQLTVITGIPSHGKSSVMDDYIIALVNDYGFKASWFSPEHNPKGIHQSSFAKKVIGKKFWGDYRMSETDLDAYIKWANEKIYITSQDDDLPTWDWLFDKMKEQIYFYGIKIFMIDAFNKVIMSTGHKTEIDVVLTKLTNFCVRHDVLIFLVVHPTKMRKKEDGSFEIPTLYDCSGSADFRNQTHNGITIYRIFEDENNSGKTIFINTKTKFEFQGEINGTANLQYCEENGRFFSNGKSPLEYWKFR
jgi:twinkle protein